MRSIRSSMHLPPLLLTMSRFLVVGKRPRTIVLTGRIVSAKGDTYGLLFAGAPEWEQWRGA